MRARRTVALGIALAGLAAGAPSAPAAQLESVGTFSSPLSVAAPPGDPDRVFVVEQAGTIQELIDGVKQPQPFLNITPLVNSGGERGLLSMAFAPDYATSHHLFVYYTANTPTVAHSGDIEIDQFTASSPDHVDASTRARVLTIPHYAQANHNGGQLQFGPDGMLYAGTGDGGGGGDGQGNGQNLTVSDPANNRSPLLGKVLRVQPMPGDVAAPGNPFMADPDVWMLGLRNPWRFSFDSQTGDMIIGDVGQDLYEEIDFAPSPGPGLAPGSGTNFGWNRREGLHSYPATNETPASPFTDPVIEENHSPDGWLAIIGGYVVRDPGLPEFAGTYLFGDNSKGELYGATVGPSGATNVRDLRLAVPGLSGMGQDACGRVYVALLGGDVQRLVNDSGGYACTTALAVIPSLPGGGAPAPAPPPAAKPPDGTAPTLMLTHARQRHIAAFGLLVLHAGCSEHCTMTASWHVRIGRHVLGVHRATAVVAAGSQVTLKLTLSHTLRRLVRAALRHHRHPRLAVTVRAVDAVGNALTRRFSVALTG